LRPLQTAINAAWTEVPQSCFADAPSSASLGRFDHDTPVSYRLDAELNSGQTVELWGYLQVRRDPKVIPQPLMFSQDLITDVDSPNSFTRIQSVSRLPTEETDLLTSLDPTQLWQMGKWTKQANTLECSKAYGVRMEMPTPPAERYRLILVVEPLDEPNGLILGQRSGEQRFLVLLNYGPPETPLSGLENVSGKAIGNETTFRGSLFQKNRVSQVIVTVEKTRCRVEVDGRKIVDWEGDRSALSLNAYWSTPDATKLFLGAYDCRYRFHRISIEPLANPGS